MKLPNCERAVVSREKLVDYLLSTTHRDGQHKAAFFGSFGFRPENWETLAWTKVEESPYGRRYVIEGIMLMADGRDTLLRTVWFIDTDTDTPRFVTAYPL